MAIPSVLENITDSEIFLVELEMCVLMAVLPFAVVFQASYRRERREGARETAIEEDNA